MIKCDWGEAELSGIKELLEAEFVVICKGMMNGNVSTKNELLGLIEVACLSREEIEIMAK